VMKPHGGQGSVSIHYPSLSNFGGALVPGRVEIESLLSRLRVAIIRF
jgi:hypothetical protein